MSSGPSKLERALWNKSGPKDGEAKNEDVVNTRMNRYWGEGGYFGPIRAVDELGATEKKSLSISNIHRGICKS